MSNEYTRFSNKNIISLNPNEIFVFGSNMAGRHGKGAALQAMKFGAIYGTGKGIQGQTYAIPTKNENLKPLPLSSIRFYVYEFIEFARLNPEYKFLVTEIGCGLAGFSVYDIAPMFIDAYPIENIYLTKSFYEIIRQYY